MSPFPRVIEMEELNTNEDLFKIHEKVLSQMENVLVIATTISKHSP